MALNGLGNLVKLNTGRNKEDVREENFVKDMEETVQRRKLELRTQEAMEKRKEMAHVFKLDPIGAPCTKGCFPVKTREDIIQVMLKPDLRKAYIASLDFTGQTPAKAAATCMNAMVGNYSSLSARLFFRS